jgi:hypothetical protein
MLRVPAVVSAAVGQVGGTGSFDGGRRGHLVCNDLRLPDLFEENQRHFFVA